MPGEVVQLGPFTGGVTTRVNDPASLQEEDLQVARNFIYDIYGNLVSRPPILDEPGAPDPQGEPWEVLLTGFFSGAVEPEVIPFTLIGNEPRGVWIKYGTDDWLQIAAGYRSTAVLGARGNEQVIWIAKFNTRQGGYWAPGDTIMNTLSSIPGANKVLWYKERLFFLNTGNNEAASRVAYSDIKPVDNSDFPSGNEIFVNINDGQSIIDGIVFLDNIYVFKYSSTYIITYDISISRVQVRPVSNTVGATNQHCIQIYADQLFVYHERFIWRFTGSSFVPLSQKLIIQPVSENLEPPSLSIWTDSLVLRFGTVAYVYSFYTDAWTTWASDRMFNWLVEFPDNEQYTKIKYLGGDLTSGKLIHMDSVWSSPAEDNLPAISSETIEQFTCHLQTKQFDFASTATYKRIFWWGVTITYHPAVLASTEAFAGFRPVDENNLPIQWEPIKVSNPLSTGAHNQLFKFLRSFRFRLAEFYITFETDGLYPNSVQNLVVSLKDAQGVRGSKISQATAQAVPAKSRGMRSL
jgi:hypothetical protein